MPSPLFVIAQSADHKVVNRLLLHLRDWAYGESPTWDCFHLVTMEKLPGAGAACTIPPVSESDLSNNVWKGKTVSDVEGFLLNDGNEKHELNVNTFLILDEQGVKDGTVIMLNLPYNDDEEDEEPNQKRYDKVRVPWGKTYIMWCNLDIANMDFQDFVEDNDGDDDDVEWWTYRDDADDRTEDEIKDKRNDAIVELEQKGLA